MKKATAQQLERPGPAEHRLSSAKTRKLNAESAPTRLAPAAADRHHNMASKQEIVSRLNESIRSYQRLCDVNVAPSEHVCDVLAKTDLFKAWSAYEAAQAKKEAVFPCEEPGCGLSFTRAFNLKRHALIHVPQPSHMKETCTECGASFDRAYDLKVHQRKHTDEKPYTCHTCHKAFSRSSSLRIHERIHERAAAPISRHPQHAHSHAPATPPAAALELPSGEATSTSTDEEAGCKMCGCSNANPLVEGADGCAKSATNTCFCSWIEPKQRFTGTGSNGAADGLQVLAAACCQPSMACCGPNGSCKTDGCCAEGKSKNKGACCS